jgi:hypothetical protein
LLGKADFCDQIMCDYSLIKKAKRKYDELDN